MIKETNEYRKQLYALQKKATKDVAEQKLRDKGVRVGEEGYNVKALKSEYRKEKGKEKLGKLAKSFVGVPRKPMVKKSHMNIPSYNSEKVLTQMGAEQGALVREVPKKVIVQDNRSLFFKGEEESEVKSARSWLFKD